MKLFLSQRGLLCAILPCTSSILLLLFFSPIGGRTEATLLHVDLHIAKPHVLLFPAFDLQTLV